VSDWTESRHTGQTTGHFRDESFQAADCTATDHHTHKWQSTQTTNPRANKLTIVLKKYTKFTSKPTGSSSHFSHEFAYDCSTQYNTEQFW